MQTFDEEEKPKPKRCRTLTGENRRQCGTCGAFFSSAGHLKRHEYIHSKMLDWECPVESCPLRFYRKDNTKCHWKRHVAKIESSGDEVIYKKNGSLERLQSTVATKRKEAPEPATPQSSPESVTSCPESTRDPYMEFEAVHIKRRVQPATLARLRQRSDSSLSQESQDEEIPVSASSFGNCSTLTSPFSLEFLNLGFALPDSDSEMNDVQAFPTSSDLVLCCDSGSVNSCESDIQIDYHSKFEPYFFASEQAVTSPPVREDQYLQSVEFSGAINDFDLRRPEAGVSADILELFRKGPPACELVSYPQ